MDAQVGVRVGDGLEHVEKETDARLNLKTLPLAIAIDRFTVHVLENEVGLARCRDARIDEASDMRMRHLRKKSAFTTETLLAGAPDQRDVQQLDGDASFAPPITALRQPD